MADLLSTEIPTVRIEELPSVLFSEADRYDKSGHKDKGDIVRHCRAIVQRSLDASGFTDNVNGKGFTQNR